MPACWVVISLLVVAQADGEVPERLPPVPPELLSTAPSAIFSAESFPNLTAPTYMGQNFEQRGWPANVPQSEDRLNLPPLPAFPDIVPAEPRYETPAFDEELPQPGTRLTFATLGAGTGFGMTSFDANHTWLLGYGDGPPLNITPGVGLHFWTDPVGVGLPARVYDLYLDFQWVPWQTDCWSVSVGLTPGLYGDFEQIGSNTFQLTGWIVANRQLGPHWQLLFGVAYVRQLQSNILPVGGGDLDAQRRCSVRTDHSQAQVRLAVSGDFRGFAMVVRGGPIGRRSMGCCRCSE